MADAGFQRFSESRGIGHYEPSFEERRIHPDRIAAMLATFQYLPVRDADIVIRAAFWALHEIEVIRRGGFRQLEAVLFALARQPFKLRVGMNQPLSLALHGFARIGA